MQDLFERVREYYYQERGRGWEMNWEPHQLDLSDRWSCIAPRNKNDLRRMFVGTLLYAKAGLTSREEAEALFIEKNRLAGKIQDLGDYTLYTTKVDYAVVKDIEEDGEYVGFDVLLRYEPEQSAVEQAAASAAQRDRIRHVLHDGSPDAEKLRNRIITVISIPNISCPMSTTAHLNSVCIFRALTVCSNPMRMTAWSSITTVHRS